MCCFRGPYRYWKAEKISCINHQVLIKLRQAGGNTLRSEIHKLISSIWNEEELPQQWKETIIVPTYEMDDIPDCSYYKRISLLPSAYKILSNILVSRLTPHVEEVIRDYECVIAQLLIRHSTFVRYWRKSWSIMGQYISYCRFWEGLWLVRREVLYNIVTEFGMPMKLVRLIKTCLNETYS
jgi:hypothetical protein